jgi:hypothetical protein
MVVGMMAASLGCRASTEHVHTLRCPNNRKSQSKTEILQKPVATQTQDGQQMNFFWASINPKRQCNYAGETNKSLLDWMANQTSLVLGSQKTADRIAVATATRDPKGKAAKARKARPRARGSGIITWKNSLSSCGRAPVLSCPTRAIDLCLCLPVVVLARARAATALLPSPVFCASMRKAKSYRFSRQSAQLIAFAFTARLGSAPPRKPCSRSAVLQS